MLNAYGSAQKTRVLDVGEFDLLKHSRCFISVPGLAAGSTSNTLSLKHSTYLSTQPEAEAISEARRGIVEDAGAIHPPQKGLRTLAVAGYNAVRVGATVPVASGNGEEYLNNSRSEDAGSH